MASMLIVRVGQIHPDYAELHGDYPAWIAAPMDGLGLRFDVVDPREGDPLPPPGEHDGIVVTGSSAMVTDRADWSVRTASWLADIAAAGVPVLGICYGHQLLADALGGAVGDTPGGREIGTVELTLTIEGQGDVLLYEPANPLVFQATHSESAVALPDGAIVLARGERDPHHAFRIGEHVWGVQFHPEFHADVSRMLIRRRADAIRAEGFDPDALLAAVRHTEHGDRLLRRFGEIVAKFADPA